MSKSPAPGLYVLHTHVDRAVSELEAQHRGRLQCARGCSSCCVDDMSVFDVEADRIRHHHSELLAKAAPHPEGACAFLDSEGACRIYEDRPYVCRTQGLPLRWLEEGAEHRDICGLNNEGPPLVSLPPERCWPIGPVESKLRELQSSVSPDGELPRVRLRDLFKNESL